MRPLNWQYALLQLNPFSYVSPNPEKLMWAGMTSIKEQFEQLFFEAKSTSATQIVLNWGAYGSGKTHASLYFSSPGKLPLVEGPQVGDIFFLRIRTPKDPNKPDIVLYRDILEAIRFNRLRQIMRRLIELSGLESVTKRLQELTESEVLGRAIALLGLEPDSSGKLVLVSAEQSSSDWQRLLESYLFSQQTKNDLKTLKLSRGIDTAQERFRILGAILQCIIGFDSAEVLNKHSRVILWIDEMEDLIYFATKQYRPFTQGLRELIDRLPNYFTLLMNFTLASPEALEDTTVVLGEAVIERITRTIYFQEPDEQAAFLYVRDQLNFYRNQQPAELNLPEVYPFSEDGLKRLISMLSRRTPRELNKRCSDVISAALMRNIISAPGKGIITPEFISQLEDEQMDLES